MAVFINPGANDGSVDDRSMLLEMYVQGTNMPLQAPAVFDNTNISGITNVPAEPGGSYRHRFDATAPAPFRLSKGDKIGGQIAGQYYKTITRDADDLMVQSYQVHESDRRRVEWTAQTLGLIGQQHRYNLGLLKSRRVVRALAKAARLSSKTISVSGVSLYAFNQGTVISQGGGSTTLNTAVTAAYGLTDANTRERTYRTLELLRLTLDRKNAPSGAGMRNCIVDAEFMAGLHSYGNDKLFSVDNVMVSPNGDMPRQALYLPNFDLTILATVNRYTGNEESLPSNGNYGAGILPAGNVLDGPSALQINCNPTSTTGFPVVLGFVATNGKGAVHVTEEKAITPVYDMDALSFTETYALAAQWTVDALNPEAAFAVEVTSNSTSTLTYA